MKIEKLIPLRKKVSFETLGCRLNIAETGAIKEIFVNADHEVVSFSEEADVVVINTCTVTDSADHNCRNIIRKARKISPKAKIVVIGCYAQVASEEIAKIDGVDLILGTSEKHKILDYLYEEEQIIKVDRSDIFWSASNKGEKEHTRGFLKIQDGCNYVCAYCIIPFARGKSKALALDDVLKEAKRLSDDGHKEIVLAGVNIGEYQSLTGESLSILTDELLKIEKLKRLRFSSIEPNTITDSLLFSLKSSIKIMNHFHIPLQSGDDEILKLMRRKYSTQEYKSVVMKLYNNFDNVGIGADVIVGFPSETESSFEKTFAFIESLPLTHFHVFPYSKRKGTTAFLMKDQISSEIKKRRVRALIELGEKKLNTFKRKQIGLKNDVLFENYSDGFWYGHTSNFLPVRLKTTNNMKNKIVNIILNEENILF